MKQTATSDTDRATFDTCLAISDIDSGAADTDSATYVAYLATSDTDFATSF